MRKKQEGIAETAAEAARAEKETPGAAIRDGSVSSQGAVVTIRGREGEADGSAETILRGRLLRDMARGS